MPLGKAVLVWVVGIPISIADKDAYVEMLQYMTSNGDLTCAINGVKVRDLGKYIFAAPFQFVDMDTTVGVYLV